MAATKYFLVNFSHCIHLLLTYKDVEQCYYHGVVKDWQGGEFIPGSMAALQVLCSVFCTILYS